MHLNNCIHVNSKTNFVDDQNILFSNFEILFWE